jgi:hypothetical protein
MVRLRWPLQTVILRLVRRHTYDIYTASKNELFYRISLVMNGTYKRTKMVLNPSNKIKIVFMLSKGGACSCRLVRPSVRLSICPSVDIVWSITWKSLDIICLNCTQWYRALGQSAVPKKCNFVLPRFLIISSVRNILSGT